MIVCVVNLCRTGCSKSPEIAVKEKLHERYQEDFEIKEVQSDPLFKGNYTMIAYPQSDPSLLFRATSNDDNSYVEDFYVCTLVCRKLSEQVGKNINALNGSYYICSKPTIDTLNIPDKDITVKEYVEMFPGYAFRTYLFYCPETMDPYDFSSNIQQMFSELEYIDCSVYVYVVPDEKSLGKIQNYLETHDRLYDEFGDISDDFYKGSIEYKDGAWDKSLEEIEEMVR